MKGAWTHGDQTWGGFISGTNLNVAISSGQPRSSASARRAPNGTERPQYIQHRLLRDWRMEMEGGSVATSAADLRWGRVGMGAAAPAPYTWDSGFWAVPIATATQCVYMSTTVRWTVLVLVRDPPRAGGESIYRLIGGTRASPSVRALVDLLSGHRGKQRSVAVYHWGLRVFPMCCTQSVCMLTLCCLNILLFHLGRNGETRAERLGRFGPVRAGVDS